MLKVEKIFNIANKLETVKVQPTSFLIGDPIHKPPSEFYNALTKNIFNEDSFRYCNQQGDLGTREIISDYYKKDFLNLTENNILVSHGSKPIASLIFDLLLSKGDLAMLQKPYYPSYFSAIKSHCNLIVSEKVEDIINFVKSNSVKLVTLISPNNPDGEIISRKNLSLLLSECTKRKTYLLIDEAYNDFIYEKIEKSKYNLNNKFLIILRTFSKGLGISGLRLGYCIADSNIISKLKYLQMIKINPANSLIQFAIRDSLKGISSNYFEKNKNYYLDKLKYLVKELKNIGFEAKLPKGGFYLYLKIDKILSKNKFDNSLDFCKKIAKDHQILIWPGEDFGDDNCIRISVTHSDEKSIDLLCNVLKKYS